MGSPRPLAAAIAIWRLYLFLSCPMKSARDRGRRLVSRGASSALGLPEMIRAIISPPEKTAIQAAFYPSSFYFSFPLVAASGDSESSSTLPDVSTGFSASSSVASSVVSAVASAAFSSVVSPTGSSGASATASSLVLATACSDGSSISSFNVSNNEKTNDT